MPNDSGADLRSTVMNNLIFCKIQIGFVDIIIGKRGVH